MKRVFNAALRLVPAEWRETVRLDLEQDALAQKRGALWCALQAAFVAMRMRWTFGGGAMFSDLRSAVRSLARARWFTIGAAVTFALGIGVNLAVFSVVDRLIFRPLPFSNSQDLVSLRSCNSKTGQCGGSFPAALVQNAGELSAIGEMAAISYASQFALGPDADASPLNLHPSSPNVLRVLGVRPVKGRDFEDDDVQAKRSAALISFESWQGRFGGDPDIVGRRIGKSLQTEIVGVLPAGFIPPSWIQIDPNWHGLVLSLDDPGVARIARLKTGSSVETAQAEVSALAGRVLPPAPAAAAGPLPRIRVDRLEAVLFERYSKYAWLVAAAAGIVLLMACANLAGLLIARGRSREHEAAIRTALGATSSRVVFAAMVEAGLVCFTGAGIAWLTLLMTSRLVASTLPPIFARYMESAMEPRVVVMAFAASAVCGVVAGAWPGARMAYVPVAAVLQRGGRTGRQSRLPGGRTLLVIEAALGVLLVLGAALAIRSFTTLATESLGYEPRDLYRVTVAGGPGRSAAAQSLLEYQELLRLSSEASNVVAVAGADSVPTNGATAMRGFSKDRSIRGARYEVTAGFFRVVGGTLVAGREFTDEDVQTLAPVAMLNEAALALALPGVSAKDSIGRVLTLKDEVPRTILGIVPQLRRNAHGDPDEAALYVPLGNEPAFYGEALLRMAPGTAPPLDQIRQLVAARLGPRTVRVTSAESALAPSLRDPRFRAVLLGAMALCALLLAGAGLYAIASFDVSQQRHEMGVRMTLGASAGDIQRHVILGALWPTLGGISCGIVAGFWATAVIESFLYKTNHRDPLTIVVVAAVLLATATLAAWIPARRASRTDPAVVLRAQ